MSAGNELTAKDVFRLIAPVWEKAMEERRYSDAMIAGFLGYFLFRDAKDETLESVGVSWIWGPAHRLMQDNSKSFNESPSERFVCSFCGRGEPHVRLAAGIGTGTGTTFICNDCVTTLSEVFRKGSS
jgi:hypothetical protein